MRIQSAEVFPFASFLVASPGGGGDGANFVGAAGAEARDTNAQDGIALRHEAEGIAGCRAGRAVVGFPFEAAFAKLADGPDCFEAAGAGSH